MERAIIDYNALTLIYDRVGGFVDVKKQIKLDNVVSDLYSKLTVKKIKSRIKPIKYHKLVDYRFKPKKPKEIKFKKYKVKVSGKEKRLHKVRELLKKGRHKKAIELYSKDYPISLPAKPKRLELKEVGVKKPEVKEKAERYRKRVSKTDKFFDRVHDLVREGEYNQARDLLGIKHKELGKSKVKLTKVEKKVRKTKPKKKRKISGYKSDENYLRLTKLLKEGKYAKAKKVFKEIFKK